MMQKIKVLMVDDEKQFRTTTKKILNRKGFEVLQAADGEQALAMMEEMPQVVVLDIKMPGMDGLSVLEKIKKLAPDIPVIMLTGHASQVSAQEAHWQGAFDYLAKPCDIDLLAGKINEAFHSRSHEDPRAEKLVKDVMVPLEEYTQVNTDNTVGEAVAALRKSFEAKLSTDTLMETGHRSMLVMDSQKRVQGILCIMDLVRATMPVYLNAPKPFLADAIQYSPMFWRGLFTKEILSLKDKTVGEIMSEPPKRIKYTANLAQASHGMLQENCRRMLVVKENTPVGILREQDLFFEMVSIIRESE
ncbi:response regulator [Dethiosulfatarculus sandiegensis]|uniref:Histidine kinase n=1 Tax=Dethiosulfatarculus sandiegensis TaxID=1429043 RepID=A0A0D2GGP0_9BACT|nr:response regulator [Dethiosulfatarculus sandiegensis]KIX14057.1 histidine kinase [Dethiosulfatarculus sandiegensis]